MYSYIALIWNHLDRARVDPAGFYASQLIRADWKNVMSVPGVSVFHRDAESGSSGCLQLSHQSGVVLGTLFRKAETSAATSAKAQLDDRESARVIETRGEHLLNCYWGRYVAVLYDDETNTASVLREPSGGLPCLKTAHRGIEFFFSDVESVLDLGISAFSINWKYIGGIVCSRGLQLRETGLREISEVQPGERVDMSFGRCSRSMQWNPFRIAQRNPIESTVDAVRAVRNVTTDCVHAWASCHKGILHRLSGGLDSSIVASCLSDAPSRPSVACINYFGLDVCEDERPFARSVAEQAGFQLIEIQHDPRAVSLKTMLDIVRSERPRFLIYHVEHSELEAHLAREVSASAMFGGAGGDGLFYQNNAILAAVDYLYTHGSTPRLWRIALDAARVDRVSVWAVLRQAVGEVMLNRRWDPMDEIGAARMFVSPEVVRSVQSDRSLAHPWMDEAAGVPHGKLWHAMGVSTPLPFYDPLGRGEDPENIYPLISQPLLELCMRIPVYALIDGGWDRAIARRAFASSLPCEIVRRRAKGSSTRSARVLYEHNLPFIREMMLDGILVREGLLDRKQLEVHLKDGRPTHSVAFGEILIEHLSTEAWLRSWSKPVGMVTAA